MTIPRIPSLLIMLVLGQVSWIDQARLSDSPAFQNERFGAAVAVVDAAIAVADRGVGIAAAAALVAARHGGHQHAQLEEVVGVLHVRRLAAAPPAGPFDLATLVEPPLMVPEGTPVLRLIEHLHRHDEGIAKKVVGLETVDHPTDRQIVAYARQYFEAADQMK